MFIFLKKYIIKKITNSLNSYVNLFSDKDAIIEKIKICKNANQIKETLCFAIKQNMYSISNLLILVDFYEYLKKEINSLEKINEEIILDFLFIYSSNKSSTTSNRVKNTILSFCNNYRSKFHNLTAINIKAYRSNKRIIYFNDFLSRNEIKKILNYVDTNYVDEIDIAILKTLIRTGIRVSELTNIKKDDIYMDDPEFYIINIKGKNSLYRLVYIKKEHIKEEFKVLIKNSNKWIFEKNKKRISPASIYYLVRKTLKKNNIIKNKNGPHLFRHTFATHLYRKTKDIVLVQESLGHRSLRSTQIYIHTDLDYLKKICSVFDEEKV